MAFFLRNRLLPWWLILASLSCLMLPVGANASPSGDAIKHLSDRFEASREIRLSDLGFSEPVVLSGTNAHRELYIPLPEGINVTDASINFRATYLKSDDTPTGVVLSVDGIPQALEITNASTGDIRKTLSVTPGMRKNRYVRLDIDWESTATDSQANRPSPAQSQRCPGQPIVGNQLAIAPDTILRYRYDTRSVSTVKQAWEILPRAPSLLVAGKAISKDGFDTAWRVGTRLRRLGRRARLLSFPALGDTVDLTTLSVPPALAAIPAYASLIGKERIALSDVAQAGALLTLSAPAIAADMAIVDAPLRLQINESLDALRSQLASDADAMQAFDVWRLQRMPLAAKPTSAGVAVGTYAGQSLIAVQVAEGKEAWGTFEKVLLPLLTTAERKAMGVLPADTGTSDDVAILPWGPASSTFNVIDSGHWVAPIPLEALSSDGRMATKIHIAVSATPDSSGTRPVLTLFWNDILLNAMQLRADQQPETLTARVPAYAIGLNNVIRISVQRDQKSTIGDCDEVSESYPVTVLAPSHISKGSPDPDGTFQGLLPLLAGPAQLFIPSSYLKSSAVSLQTVISLAASTGLSVTKTTLTITADDHLIEPTGPFLAIGTGIKGVVQDISVDNAQQIQVEGRRADWLLETKPGGLSVAQVARSHKQDGIIWYALDSDRAEVGRSFALSTGNAVILGPSGPVSWINGDGLAVWTPGPGESAFDGWQQPLSWGVPLIIGLILAFVILLILAAYHRRKNDKKH